MAVFVSPPGFVLLHCAEPDLAPRDALEAALVKAGWRPWGGTRNCRLLLSPGGAMPMQSLGPSGILVGRYYGRSLSTFSEPGEKRAKALLREGWGGYVAFWEDGMRLQALRDPSGAIDLLTWAIGPVTIMASDMPLETDCLLPPAAAIDWAHLARVLDRTGASSHGVGVTGITAVAGGDLASVGPEGLSIHPLWRPADFARMQRSANTQALRRVVDGVVAWLMSDHTRAVGEVSGGFDSAVVAATTASEAGHCSVRWINYRARERESDESPWVEALKRKAGLDIDIRFKSVNPVRLDDLADLARGLRPGLYGLDIDYDGDIAQAMSSFGATALLTGQGGDAVFFNAGTPALAIDRVRRAGLLGLTPAFLYRTARWTRRSVWSIVETAWRDLVGLAPRRREDDDPDRPPGPDVHPWLNGLGSIPPAKQDQIRQLVNCQVFWSPCQRATVGEILHPLLTQPVMEHTLAIPADLLTRGGRGRALAREAFRDRLPVALLERRGKGELSTHYGQVVLESLPQLRQLLIDGKLMTRGLIGRDETEALLDPDVLIVSGDYNVALVRALLELWVQTWSARLARSQEDPGIPGGG